MKSSPLALAAYLAVSFLYFGIPIAAHPDRDWIGSGADPQIFVWSLGWWPHAILHWQNPIQSAAVWTPHGLDLAWVSSIPGLALAFSPVTLAAGPVVAYNVASIAMPALAAWTAFLLCRHVTRSFWPSLAGGYLFGFSSYMLGQLAGHLHASSVFLVPLVALVVIRFVEGTLDARGFALRLGLLLAGQLLLSTEVLLTLTLALVAALLLAYGWMTPLRDRLRATLAPTVGGYGIAAVLTSPFLVYAFIHFEGGSINSPSIFSADLANLVVPTPFAAFSTHWTHAVAAEFSGNNAENGAYLGLPLLAILAWFAWSKRRSAGGRFLTSALALGILCELGPVLRIRGAHEFTLPWRLVSDRVLFDNVLPVRLAVYVALAAAVAVAWWAADARRSRVIRIALVALAAAAIFPHLGASTWHERPGRPLFFTADLDDRCIRTGETVLALPYPSMTDAMLWQTEDGFRYRLADVSLTPVVPRDVPDRWIVNYVIANDTPLGGGQAILRLARAQRANVILVDAQQSEPWRSLLARNGVPGREVGGMFVYRLDGTLASCRV